MHKSNLGKAFLLFLFLNVAFAVPFDGIAQTNEEKLRALMKGRSATPQFQKIVKHQSEKALKDLIGWVVPGLEGVKVKGVQTGQNYFSGELPAVAGGRIKPKIVGFKSGQQHKFTVGITVDRVNLADFSSALRNTPLHDLAFQSLQLISVPPENANQTTPVPPQLRDVLGNSPVRKPAGTSFTARTKLIGSAGALANKLGVSARTLPLSGSIDPGLFAGKITGSRLKQEFLDRLDITLPLPSLKPNWRPTFISFRKAALRIVGSGASIAMRVDTGIDLKLAKTLSFSPASATYDKDKRALSIEASLAEGSPTLSLPIHGASVSGLRFSATIGGGGPAFALDGQISINKKDHTFSTKITGRTKADYVLNFGGKFTLADLGAPNIPGLDKVSVTNPVISNIYSSGDIQIGTVDAEVFVFKPEGLHKPVVAVLPKASALTDFVPALAQTPLADLKFQLLSFMFAPKENAGIKVRLPEDVAPKFKTGSLTLKSGVNIHGHAEIVGKSAQLLKNFNIPTKGGAVSGTFDPSVFQQPKNLGKAFLAQLDLKIPVRDLRLPGVSFTDPALRIKGYGDGIGAKMTATVKASIANESLNFENVEIEVAEHGGQKTYHLAGTSEKKWSKALGIPWLSIRHLGLDAKLGAEKSVSISGLTSVGKVHNLKASIDLSVAGGSVDDYGIALTGSPIPLDAFPGFHELPHIDGFALQDVVVSKREIAGTTLTKKIKLLDGLRTVVFRVGEGWNFAMLRPNLTFADMIPLKGPAEKVLKKIKMGEAAIVISVAGLNNPLSALPPAARAAMEKIYGANDRLEHLHLTNGLNLVTAIDPRHFGKTLSDLSGKGGTPLAFSGGIGGLFGGPPSIDIAASIPRIKMPQSLHFLELPSELQTSFFVRMDEAVTDFGIELATLLDVKTKRQKIKFDTTLDFEIDTQGGLAIDVQGRTDSVWKNALGIKGFNLDPGTRMEIKVGASTQVDVTFVGKSHIGRREVDVTATVGVIGGETIDKGGFEGSVSELGLHDLIALTNSVAKATGGKPADPSKIADIKLTKVDLAFASPGVDVPEMKLVGGGIRLAGDLWFLIKKEPLGQFMAQVDETGLVMHGKMADFKVGSIGMKNTALDVAASTSIPPSPPYFKVKGEVDLFKANLGGAFSAAVNNIGFETYLNDPPLIVIDIAADIGTDKLEFTAKELASFDMWLKAELKSDLPKWLRTDGKKVVSATFESISGAIKGLETDLDNAKDKVATLDTQIAAARAEVGKEKQATDDAVTAAKAKVKSAQGTVDSFNTTVKNLESDIKTCNQKKKVCAWYDVIKKKWTLCKRVPDPGAIAKCEAKNAKYGTELIAAQASLKTAQAALAAAQLTLTGLQDGNDVDTTDLDPRVATLLAAKVTAEKTLELAKASAAGAADATDKMNKALTDFGKANVFVLKEGLIQGSLTGMIKGKPVVMGLSFEVLGKSYHNAFAFSAADPAFTAEQLGTLATYMAVKVVEAAHKNDPASKTLLGLLHDAYAKMHDASEKKLEAVMKANGLD
jgi:hypothetical protein